MIATVDDIAPSVLQRVGIIADVHGEDDILEEVLCFLQVHGPFDALLCTGDIVTGPGDPGRCCSLLMKNDVKVVRGNHDRWFFQSGYQSQFPYATPSEQLDREEKAYLHNLPPTQSFFTAIGPLMLCHGTGSNDMLAVYPGDGNTFLSANQILQQILAGGYYRVMVSGHTHRSMVRRIGSLTLINAGTLRRDYQPCFAIADLASQTVEFYRIDPVTNAISVEGHHSV